MTEIDHTFGGRIQPQQDEDPEWGDLLDLPNKGMAFVYQRLSSHEQVKKHIYSVQAQDDLAQSAKEDGYSDDQIYVENRDLGISGTEGKDERAGLAYMIDQIEAGLVESVYVVDISRLFRDQTLINALEFGELCKEQDVVIVTPHMRLNLNDRMHMRIYRMEAERAAEELEIMHTRLHGGQKIKARQGCYCGGSIPVGYILDERKQIREDGHMIDNPNHQKYQEYEPHARVVRKLFKLAQVPGQTVTQIINQCKREGVNFPPLSPEVASTPANNMSFARSKKNADGGWPLTVARVRSMLKNPAYIGWWIWGKEVISRDNHPPIVDEETFWAAQKMFETRHRPRQEHPPLPLSDLLYCGAHDTPKRMIYANPCKEGKYPYYQCRNGRTGTHSTIRATYIDGPIAEAVISQCAYSELAEQVLDRLRDEYEQAEAHRTTVEAERKRLEKQIENLEHNFANAKLTPERIGYIEAEITKRRARLRELSDIGRVKTSTPDKRRISAEDIKLVKSFLANLEQGWDAQPLRLKNAFFRLVLERVVVWQEPAKIEAKIIWQAGLEQKIIIHRPYFKPRRRWSDEEKAVLEKHFATATRDAILELLPSRNWRQIRRKAKAMGIKRKIKTKAKRKGSYAPWEDNLIRQYVRGEYTMRELQDELNGRSADSVRGRIRTLGLQREWDRRPDWKWASNTNFITEQDQSVPGESAGYSTT